MSGRLCFVVALVDCVVEKCSAICETISVVDCYLL